MSSLLPLVSVIIPVFNGERFLAEAIQSVLGQRYETCEIVVVDDGSADGTAGVAREFVDVRYIYQDNQGPASARNQGIEQSRGEFIAFLDVDDLWPPDRLHRMVRQLLDQPDVDLVLGQTQIHSVQPGKGDIGHPHVGPYLQSGLFRREVFSKVGRFDSTLRFSEDQDWFLRAREGRIHMTAIEMVTVIYRVHEDNMTQGKSWSDVDILRILKKSLDRRRDEHGKIEPLRSWEQCLKSGNETRDKE